ncbi:hypothetical protein [Nocardioides ochotonae]|uniref:hypothetical protein n=1 Tax=Nocardioides ochotonae TaxID=2685869 RepID=UPI00174B93DD|nr:hypothetical protein [Nocardioides ochotonae]
MGVRYNPPPNWPPPPTGWTPPPGWRPDPAWGPPPPGWQLWVPGPAAYAGPPAPAPAPGWTPAFAANNSGTTMVAVAAATCGLAGFVPPLWAARQRPHDAPFRKRMFATAGGLAALEVVGIVLTSTADVDERQTPTGLAADLGAIALLINLVLAVTVAVLLRNTQPSEDLPGVAEELARRRLREEYRALARRDPSLARNLRVGRPDLPRNLDDGGLLDLNALPADQLERFAALSPAEATSVADARHQLGRFTSLNELALYADLSETTTAMLSEHAVFI